MMKKLALLLVIVTVALSCSTGETLTDFDGFTFGQTRSAAIAAAKHNKIAMNFEHLTYWKRYGDTTCYVKLVFKDNHLYAFDIKSLPCKKPEDAREIMFQLKNYFETKFGPATARVMSHPNFDVVNYQWQFKNASAFIGTKLVEFQTIPRVLIIEHQG